MMINDKPQTAESLLRLAFSTNGTEPPGFRAWLRESFAAAGEDKLAAPWSQVPDHIKSEFRRTQTTERPTK